MRGFRMTVLPQLSLRRLILRRWFHLGSAKGTCRAATDRLPEWLSERGAAHCGRRSLRTPGELVAEFDRLGKDARGLAGKQPLAQVRNEALGVGAQCLTGQERG